MGEELARMAKRTLIYGAGSGTNRLLALISLPIFTRYLSPDEFGFIAVLAIFTMICRPIFGLGLGVATGIVYFERETSAARSSVIMTVVALTALSGGILVASTAAAAKPLSTALFERSDLGQLVVLQAVALALQLLAEPLMLRLQFENRAGRYALASFGGASLGLAAALILVVLFEHGVRGWIEGQVILGVSTIVLAALADRRGLLARLDVTCSRQLLVLGAPLIPSFAFLYCMLYASHYLIRVFHGLGPLGVYSIGFNVGMGMAIATGAFSNAWYPFFQSYATRQEEGARVFPPFSLAYWLSFGLLCVLAFSLARPVLVLLTTPAFHDSYRVLGPIALAQFLIGAWVFLLPGLYFAKETYLVPLVQAGAAAVSVAYGVIFIPRFGIEGAAHAIVAGAAALLVFQYLVNSWRRYLHIAYDWQRLGLLAVLAASAMAAQRVLDETFTLGPAMAGSVVIAAAYICLAWRVLSAGERNSIGRWLMQRVAS